MVQLSGRGTAWALLALWLGAGCAYKIGGGLVAGALDEMGGKGRTEGVETMGDRMLERAMLVELGHQLGSGLSAGVTEITPEQQRQLEATIEGLLQVAAQRAGKGLRKEVSPELREMIRKDIVGAFSDGLRGELGDSLEETVDRVITRAITSLRETATSEEMRLAMADLLRDSVYYAMREGHAGTPPVADTIEFTLTQNMLEPLEASVATLTNDVAVKVNESAERTEQRLRSIIGILVIFGGAVVAGYLVRTRQLRRAEDAEKAAQAELRGVDAALDLLDEGTRAEIQHRREASKQSGGSRSDSYARGGDAPPDPPRKDRSDDYMR